MQWLRNLWRWLITPERPEPAPAQPQAAPEGKNTPPGQDGAPEPETPAQEAPMAKSVTYPESWGLSPLEAAYLNALRPGKIVSADDLVKLHRARPADPADRVRRTMAGLRRKLDPLNVEIATHWGEGWQLKQRGRARLTTLLRG